MKRGWFILLALSLGVNAGWLYTVLAERARAPRVAFAEVGPGEDPLFGETSFPGEDPMPGEASPPGEDWMPGAGPPRGEGPPVIQPGCPATCEPMLRRRLQGLARRLDLEPRQREALHAIYQESLPRILASREAVTAARRTLHIAYRRPAVDPAAIRRLVVDMAAAQARLDSLVVETMLREAQVLTPEQRDRYFPALSRGRFPGAAPERGAGRR